MQHIRYALNESQSKLDQARALIRVVSPSDINADADGLYARLSALGWEWRIDGWYAKVQRK